MVDCTNIHVALEFGIPITNLGIGFAQTARRLPK